jgi:hypothetical protein
MLRFPGPKHHPSQVPRPWTLIPSRKNKNLKPSLPRPHLAGDRDLRHFWILMPNYSGRNRGRLRCFSECLRRTFRPRPAKVRSGWGSHPGEGMNKAPTKGWATRLQMGIRGGPEAEASAARAPGATPVRLQPVLGPEIAEVRWSRPAGARQPRDLLPSLLSLFVFLKQRQSTLTAIFPLPQKLPLRQTPVSSFSAMPPTSARWEMKAGEAGSTELLLLQVPRVLTTTFPGMPSGPRPFLGCLLEQRASVWAGRAGAGRSSSSLIGES